MYHRCLDAIMDEWAHRGRGSVSVMVASHNFDTIRYAVESMKKRGIAPSERVICFGQLYGMCDVVGETNRNLYKNNCMKGTKVAKKYEEKMGE